jgi:cell migration-inducing and hyaluronan-binding protein
LSRNGTSTELTGTNVRSGTEVKVTTERPEVSLTLSQMDNGSWVIFELPGFTTAASGTEQSSLDALRAASDTSYFKGPDALWVKVVASGSRDAGASSGGGSIQVSRPAAPSPAPAQ